MTADVLSSKISALPALRGRLRAPPEQEKPRSRTVTKAPLQRVRSECADVLIGEG